LKYGKKTSANFIDSYLLQNRKSANLITSKNLSESTKHSSEAKLKPKSLLLFIENSPISMILSKLTYIKKAVV
jgi:hypothetical protein